MSAPPIQTWYDGRRHRSRLEARWAVFFKTLGIQADYETEGFLVGPQGVPYLPDFWLPREKVWVEVKGSEEQLDIDLLAAAALPACGLPATGRSEEEYEVRLLILGPFSHRVGRLLNAGEPVGYCQPSHSVLSYRDGNLVQGCFARELARIAWLRASWRTP